MGEKGVIDPKVRNAMVPPGFVMEPGDPNRAFNANTGQNAHWDSETQRWTDSKTGTTIDPSPHAGAGSYGAR